MTRKSVKLTNNPLEILDACADSPVGSSVKLTQLWVIFRIKLTDFGVIVDPEWSLSGMDPFPGHADPGVFRVYIFTCYTYRLNERHLNFGGKIRCIVVSQGGGGGDITLYLGYRLLHVHVLAITKSTLFPGLSREIFPSQDYKSPKIPPFPRKWEHAWARRPLMHSGGGGGLKLIVTMIQYTHDQTPCIVISVLSVIFF